MENRRDKPGSGNAANIGSVRRIRDMLDGNGMFANLGEDWFDDYWMNYGKIAVKTESCLWMNSSDTGAATRP